MDDSLAVSIRGGARICVPRSLHLITPYVLLEQEDWFEDEIRFLRRYLQPGMRAVDGGASFGIYTMAMAQGVGASGRVWAFEPTPGTADYLQNTLELNQAAAVKLTRAALSDRPGTVAFRAGEQSELNAIAKDGMSGNVQVAALTLDQVAAEENWGDVDFVKLDVEGHEREVIAGGASFFASASPLVMFEIKAGDRVDLGTLPPFRAMGYRFYRLLSEPPILVPFDEAAQPDPFQLNVFACKDDRIRRLAAAGLLAEGSGAAPETPGDAWAGYARTAPYAQKLVRGWPQKAGLFAAADLKLYLRGLARYAQSREPALDASARISLLKQAKQDVTESIAKKDTLSRSITLARLAYALGERWSAVKALREAGPRLSAEAYTVLVEPFLAPSLRHEQMAIDVPSEWLVSAVGEQLERLKEHSSFYSGASTLALLDTVVQVPFCSPEMERRRQLVRMRSGLQAAPEPSPRLCQASDDNLNVAYWCGGGSA